MHNRFETDGQKRPKTDSPRLRKERIKHRQVPTTSFEAKKWLEGNFPSRGKVVNFPSSHKNSFFSSPSFPGKSGHFEGKGKLSLGGKIIPQRENSPNFPLEGKFCLKRCFGLWIWTLRIWGLRGPEFRSARHVLYGDASRLFLDHFTKHLVLSSVLGQTELCHEVRNCGPQNPKSSATKTTAWHCSSEKVTQKLGD